tara:strand:+ start:10704 stop:11771 length:1068 start_codon:yes stop_codon:yes gene_type:complete
MKKKILISTGGSGGHVVPAITISDHLKEEYEILISTDLRGKKYVNSTDYEIIIVDTPRLNSLFLFPFKVLKIFILCLKSYFIMKKKKIKILISTGGYMSLPLCLAAKLLGINIFLLEPNMVLGRANNFFLHFCEKIICYSKEVIGFPKKFINKIVVLNPIMRKKYYEKNLDTQVNKIFTLMIVGGSQGARVFDEIMHEIIVRVSKIHPIKIIHQTSKENIDFLKNYYSTYKIENTVFSYDENLHILLRQSNLCITRAGASTLAELSLLNVPFLAIPLPTSKDNHQQENANYYKIRKCCWVIEQNKLNKKTFEEFLLSILKNNDILFKIKNNLENLNYQNTWNNVNQKLLKIINEN